MVSLDYTRGYFAAQDSAMAFINSIDTEGLTALQIRSALYKFLMTDRPNNNG